jgi:hypothetical protein
MFALTTALLGFTPGAPLSMAPARAVVATRIVMNAGGGTETLDFTGGSLRSQKELTDEDLTSMGRRARPSIDWSNLRARLEVDFGFKDEELTKYEFVSKDDLLKVWLHRIGRGRRLAEPGLHPKHCPDAEADAGIRAAPGDLPAALRARVQGLWRHVPRPSHVPCVSGVRDDAALPAV